MYNMFCLKSKKNKGVLNSGGVTVFFIFSLFIYLCLCIVPRLDKENTIKAFFTAGFSIRIFCLEKIRGYQIFCWAVCTLLTANQSDSRASIMSVTQIHTQTFSFFLLSLPLSRLFN